MTRIETEVWMKEMKVLVTGSNGFIGSYLVERLLKMEYSVVGCDLELNNSTNLNCYLYEADFTDQKEMQQLFSKHKPDHCLHVGAIADVNYAREHRIETMKTNVFGTGVIAEMCRKYDSFLTYVSTCCVYGDTSVYPTHENAPLKPTEIYGWTKLAGEYVVKGYQQLYGLQSNILRYSTVCGPRMRKALAVYVFLSKAMKKEALPIHGNGAHTRSYIFIEDLVDATIEAMKVKNEVINIAGDEAVSTLKLAKLCWGIVNLDEEVVLEFVPDRPRNIKREHIDIGKAHTLLNWSPKTSIENGLKATYSWMRTTLYRVI